MSLLLRNRKGICKLSNRRSKGRIKRKKRKRELNSPESQLSGAVRDSNISGEEKKKKFKKYFNKRYTKDQRKYIGYRQIIKEANEWWWFHR